MLISFKLKKTIFEIFTNNKILLIDDLGWI